MIGRRRFLAITAAAVAVPHAGQAATWQGRAFGGDIAITIHGPRDIADHAMAKARSIVSDMERLFSLYDPDSALMRLNRTGTLIAPDPRFVALMQAADTAHRLTGGLFDPTIQPLWQALATGGDIPAARALIGWDRVTIATAGITLGPGQALTLNGIAQGYATDQVTEAFKALGLRDVLVNIGEYRGLGGPWRLGLADPTFGLLGQHTLRDGAIATSSPAALALGDGTHILHPTHRPLWSTVSVAARTATLADALSTALCLAPRDQVAALADDPDVDRIRLVDTSGNLFTL